MFPVLGFDAKQGTDYRQLAISPLSLEQPFRRLPEPSLALTFRAVLNMSLVLSGSPLPRVMHAVLHGWIFPTGTASKPD